MTDEMMTCAPHPTTAALEAQVGEALRKSYMFAGGHDIEGEYFYADKLLNLWPGQKTMKAVRLNGGICKQPLQRRTARESDLLPRDFNRV